MSEGKSDMKKRGIFEVFRWMIKKVWQFSRGYCIILVISGIVRAVMPFAGIFVPKLIIDELMGNGNLSRLASLVGILVLTNLLLSFIDARLNSYANTKNHQMNLHFKSAIGEKIMEMDYEYLERPDVLDLKEKAIIGLDNYNIVATLNQQMVSVFSSILTLAGVLYLIIVLNPLLILILISVVFFNALMQKKGQEYLLKCHEEWVPLNRQWGTYYGLMDDFRNGKDIRLYNAAPFFAEKVKDYNRRALEVTVRHGKYFSLYSVAGFAATALQQVITYAYLTYKAFSSSITLGDFTMYALAVDSFTQSLSSIVNSLVRLRTDCGYALQFMDFMNLQPIKVRGSRNITADGGKYTLEFRNVSFRYPGSEAYVLRNVSIVLKPGQRTSLVGMNGAGKTTFIKLLTRLYDPTEGEILLNGVNIKEYDYEEYLSLFSVVFQDFNLLALSVKENIAVENASVAADDSVADVVDKAGLGEKFRNLPKGLSTSVYKIFDPEGVEFSGGESQKLSIARAIYKNAPVVVLDEPTAALDPVAEYEIYSHFDSLIENKTAIYISHRLSSCRFCDRIAVFHDNHIVQYGTHDELIINKSGKYAEMFNAQAQYYISNEQSA